MCQIARASRVPYTREKTTENALKTADRIMARP
jgi:hypothetical protein